MKKRLVRAWQVLRTVFPLWLRTGRRPVLLVRPGALGDIVCTFPAAIELLRRHAGAACVYSCKPEFACLPPMAGVTGHVLTEGIIPQSVWRFLFSAVYTFRYADERTDTASKQPLIAEFCRQFDLPAAAEYPRLQVQPMVLARVRARLEERVEPGRPLVLIHPGPSWPIREWPRASWLALVEALKQRGAANVVQLGASNHVELGKSDDDAIPGAVSLVDQLTLEESIALISLGDVFVGVDSGLLHVAAAMRTRAVGIFGPTTPQVRFPQNTSCSFVVSPVECQGCHHRVPRLHWVTGCPYDIRCMQSISPDTVMHACLAALAGAREEKEVRP